MTNLDINKVEDIVKIIKETRLKQFVHVNEKRE